MTLLTYQQAADSLGVSKTFVKRRVAEGAITVVHLGPHIPRIKSTDLMRFIEERTSVASDGASLTSVRGGARSGRAARRSSFREQLREAK